MKKIIQKLSLLFLFLFCIIGISYAQNVEENQEVRSYLDGMFQNLDKSKVPHGLLRDYAFELVNLERYTGEKLEENNYVDRQTYEFLLRTIRSSAVATKPFGEVEDILTRQYSLGGKKTVSISGMAYQYSVIKANALEDGLIKYENEKVYDNVKNGVWQNPYQNEYVIGFCPQDSILFGTSFTFKLDRNCWLTNLSINKIELDPGNGVFRSISVGGSTSVSFGSTGSKTMKLKVTLSNGTQLLSHSRIEILDSKIPGTRAGGVVSKRIVTGTSYKGVQTSAEVSIQTRDGKIKNPLIFVEGFDPVDNPFSRTNPLIGYGAGHLNKLLDQLSKDENKAIGELLLGMFDIVYVDWIDSENYIQANANTLIEIIEWINNEKVSSSNSNIIIGQSMGGLIVRYALKTMEKNNKVHETSHFVSYDAPHLGANVPLGILYALHGTISFLENKKVIGHFINKDKKTGTLLEFAERLAHCNAARQMLVNYVDFAGNIENSLHNSWQNELATLGFPQGEKGRDFKMIGIANGSYSSGYVPSSYLTADFSGSSDLFDIFSIWAPFVAGTGVGYVLDDIWAGLLSLLPGKSTIKGNVAVNPGISQGKKITEIKLKYKKKILWMINSSRTVFSYEKNMPGGLTYDVFPASMLDLKSSEEEDNPHKFLLYDVNYSISVNPILPFIPTSSALCVGGGKKPLTASLFTNPPSLEDTPFRDNSYFQKNLSLNHIDFSTETLEWMASQIAIGIDGPKLGITGSKYRVKLLGIIPSSATWEVNNKSIASISNDGVLTVHNKGVVTLTAHTTFNSKPIKVSKDIVVGTPRFILDEVKREPGFYTIKAKCIDTQPGYADFILENKNIITYKWGIKVNNKALEWIPSDSYELRLNTMEDKDNITVYLKTVDTHGNESSPVYVKITGYDLYDLVFNTFIINNKGEVYTDGGFKLPYKSMEMPISLRKEAQMDFSSPRWNPFAAIVINEENTERGIPWSPRGYIKDVFPLDEIERICTFTEGKVAIYRLVLLNYEGKVIQRTPFNVIYKSKFPK